MREVLEISDTVHSKTVNGVFYRSWRMSPFFILICGKPRYHLDYERSLQIAEYGLTG